MASRSGQKERIMYKQQDVPAPQQDSIFWERLASRIRPEEPGVFWELMFWDILRDWKAQEALQKQGPTLEEVLAVLELALAKASGLRPEEQINLLGDKRRYIDSLRNEITLIFAKYPHERMKPVPEVDENGLVPYPMIPPVAGCYGKLKDYRHETHLWKQACIAQKALQQGPNMEEVLAACLPSNRQREDIRALFAQYPQKQDAIKVERERERWWQTLENEIKNEGTLIPAKVLMGVIDQLRKGE